jgi:hypothetical protein
MSALIYWGKELDNYLDVPDYFRSSTIESIFDWKVAGYSIAAVGLLVCFLFFVMHLKKTLLQVGSIILIVGIICFTVGEVIEINKYSV